MSTMENEDPQERANRLVPTSLAFSGAGNVPSTTTTASHDLSRTIDSFHPDSFDMKWPSGK